MTVCGEKVTGVCVAGKCPHFKRCCPVVWDKYGKIKPKTNEEWFCQLNTSEKSDFMAKVVSEAIKEHTEHGATRCESVIWWESWLKQPHTIKE